MNGVIVVKKEKGMTSRDVVNKVSKILETKKIGHTGTLDPLARGVLVLCIGTSLKLVELLMNHDKEYIAKIKLGIETDTLDITGKITKKNEVPIIDDTKIKEVLKKFIGSIKQQVPAYSAVKVNGKKLYEYARNNESIELPVHKIEIKELELIDSIKNNEFTIKCHVSKGTYIRSLVRDIGYKLNTYATLIELERTKLGNFSIEQANTIKEIQEGKHKLLTPIDIFDFPKIIVNQEQEKKIEHGQVLPKFFTSDKAFLINKEGRLLAIYMQHKNNQVKPYRMFINE